MKYNFYILIASILLSGCLNSPNRWLGNSISWEDVNLGDLEFDYQDTLWTDSSQLYFIAYIKPKHSSFDNHFANIVLQNNSSGKAKKLNSDYGFEIVGDTIYHMDKTSKNKYWQKGMEWYSINNNSYEWLSNGNPDIRTPSIEESYGRILRFEINGNSSYILKETININTIKTIMDLKESGFYYIGLPGLNVIGKDCFYDVVKKERILIE